MNRSLYDRSLIREPFHPIVSGYQMLTWSGEKRRVSGFLRILQPQADSCLVTVDGESIHLHYNQLLLVDADVPYMLIFPSGGISGRVLELELGFVPADPNAYTIRQLYHEYPAFRALIDANKHYVVLSDIDGMLSFQLQRFLDADKDKKVENSDLSPFMLLCLVAKKSDIFYDSNLLLKNRGETLYVRRALTYILNYYSQDIHSSDIAENVGISVSYLHRIFVKEIGVSINQYITRLRMNMAFQMLTHTTLPIQTIAQRVGFKNQQYFNSQFKKSIGMSATEFRVAHITRKYPEVTDVQEYSYISGQLIKLDDIQKEDLSPILDMTLRNKLEKLGGD